MPRSGTHYQVLPRSTAKAILESPRSSCCAFPPYRYCAPPEVCRGPSPSPPSGDRRSGRAAASLRRRIRGTRGVATTSPTAPIRRNTRLSCCPSRWAGCSMRAPQGPTPQRDARACGQKDWDLWRVRRNCGVASGGPWQPTLMHHESGRSPCWALRQAGKGTYLLRSAGG